MKIVISTLFILLFLVKTASAQWEQLKGPYGGDITDIVFSDTVTYASAGYGGVFRSLDNGATWATINNGLPAGKVLTLGIQDTNIYAGTTYGIYFSGDGGANWLEVNNGYQLAPNFYPYPYEILTIGNKVIVASSQGVFITTNNGSNWTSMNNGLTSLTVRAIVLQDSTLIAGTDFGIYISNNYGMNWSSSNTGFVFPTSINSLAADSVAIFAGTNDSLFVSFDNANSWTPANDGLPTTTIRDLTIINSIIYAGYPFQQDGIYLSGDYGATWYQSNNGLYNSMINCIAEGGNNILTGTVWGGVFSSTDNGFTWTASNEGLAATLTLAIHQFGNKIYSGNYFCGVQSSSDQGQTWSQHINGLNDINSINIRSIGSKDSILFIGTNRGGVYRSLDSAQSWTNASNGLITFLQEFHSFTTIEPYIFVSGGGIYRSSNYGLSWSPIYSVNDYCLAKNGTDIYCGSSYYGKAYRSLDSGSTWSQIYTASQSSFQTRAFAFNGSDIYLGGSDAVHFSPDDCTNWYTVNNGLIGYEKDIHSLLVIGNSLIAGTSLGVFASEDNATTWTTISSGLPFDTKIYDLKIIDNYVYAATYGRGIWRRAISDINLGIGEYKSELTISIFPNPSNGVINIISDNLYTDFKISVFNLSGQILYTNELSNFQGTTSINLSGSPKGIYFIHIYTENGIIVSKIILE